MLIILGFPHRISSQSILYRSHVPCFEDPSHSFCGVKDILLLRGMLPPVFRDRQDVTFLGLEQ